MCVFGLDQPRHHAAEDGGVHRQAAAGEEPDAGGDAAAPGGDRGAERHHPVSTGTPGTEQQLRWCQTAGRVCSVPHQGAEGCWTGMGTGANCVELQQALSTECTAVAASGRMCQNSSGRNSGGMFL